MIEKETVEALIAGILEGTEIFLVGVRIDSNNKIQVHVDKDGGISIDDCVSVSRALGGKLDRDQEDFAMEVSSPGLDSPFRVIKQYEKNIGKMVSVQCDDGDKFLGTLKEVNNERILLEIPSGKKGGESQLKELTFNEIKSARIHIQF